MLECNGKRISKEELDAKFKKFFEKPAVQAKIKERVRSDRAWGVCELITMDELKRKTQET